MHYGLHRVAGSIVENKKEPIMLMPIKHKLCNVELGKPDNWNEVDGECRTLPVHKDGDIYYSWYRFTWKQRLQVLLGYPVRLALLGWSHPPVNLTVTKG